MPVSTPFPKDHTQFRVQNISADGKTVRCFGFPILYNLTYDLLSINHISEADIRHSLLKGDLMIKIKQKEIRVVESDIDLLQFNEDQKAFLKAAGIIKGLEIDTDQLNENIEFNGGTGSLPVTFHQNISVLGNKNGVNRYFMTPHKFYMGTLEGSTFSIHVRHNGKGLDPDLDFAIQESGGPGTGYDTIIFESFIPTQFSNILVDYVTENA
jgi:hypothetical protein